MNMLVNLETLIELKRYGTMAKASAALRISQSAVSKRISALEEHYGAQLTERQGRNVILTHEGQGLLDRVGPLLSDLRQSLGEKVGETRRRVKIGVAESILGSWGAKALKDVFEGMQVDLEFHSHRGPVVIEKVESGLYDLGLCAGKITNTRSVIFEQVCSEELVLVAKNPHELKIGNKSIDILSIERSSLTWKSVQDVVEKRKLNPVRELESFFALAQLSKAGYGVGILPIGLARELGFRKPCILHLKPKVYRPILVLYKKSKLERPDFQECLERISKIKC